MYSELICKQTQCLGYGYGGFRGSVAMGILWGFPQVFCGYGLWDGMGMKSDPHGSLANRGAGLVNPSAQNSQSVAGSWDNWVNKSSWVRMVIGQYW